MRIKGFEITNYKGIKHVSIDGLENEPVVVISGKNGTGKTLVLEAILLAWSRYASADESVVGPWGNSARIELEIFLTKEEREAIAEWRRSSREVVREIPETARIAKSWSSASGGSYPSKEEFPINHLRNARFRRDYKFGIVDFMPASRNASVGSGMSIDLGMFGEERREQARKVAEEGILKYRHGYHSGNVLDYLATSDYLDLTAARRGEQQSNEYQVINDKFKAATGKGLTQPEIDSEKGMRILVETAHGAKHDVSALSSGEQEMLNLIYFVRRLSARGGVLLLDEPEQHLHPTLQVAVFETMTEMADRAQVLAVSHSPNLIVSMPPRSLMEMLPPDVDEPNQLVRLENSEKRTALLAGMGVSPSSLLQSDAMVIVEGHNDENILRALFPIDLSRCKVVVAGSVDRVMDTCLTLEKIGEVLPWICLRDRDMLSDDDRDSFLNRHPNLHIWHGRMLENELVDPDLIVQTFKRAGRSIEHSVVIAVMRNEADSKKEDVIAELVARELSIRYPMGKPEGRTKLEKLESYLAVKAQSYVSRADEFDVVVRDVKRLIDERWELEWHSLSHGKSLMAAILSISPFKGIPDLSEALAATYSSGEAQPLGLMDLKRCIMVAIS